MKASNQTVVVRPVANVDTDYSLSRDRSMTQDGALPQASLECGFANAANADVCFLLDMCCDGEDSDILKGSFAMNGETHLAADIHLAVNFALTDSNPNRPLGLPPSLDGEVFDLPWLRGYGNVKSLPVAYQESPALKQAAVEFMGRGVGAILGGFERFLTQWTGLEAAHQAKGVTRTTLTLEDKAWMLETLTGQDVHKSAIEAANFGATGDDGRGIVPMTNDGTWRMAA